MSLIIFIFILNWQTQAVADISHSLPPPLADTNTIVTVAGQLGSQGYAGDHAPATLAQLNHPSGIVIDNVGNDYVADTANQRIRQIDSRGQITTLAGNGNQGYRGDNSLATQAHLNNPVAIALDQGDNLYIADRDNYRIRQVDIKTGLITTVAGNGQQGDYGDGGLATAAQFNSPIALALDHHNNLYIADSKSHRIRKIDHNSGLITTVAGNGQRGYHGDGEAATAATLNQPSGLTFDSRGNLYIADSGNHRIRKIDHNGLITTYAGNGNAGYSGDGRAATAAKLNMPTGIVIDNAGNLYIADQNNHRIRKVDHNGTITTVAGNGNQGTTHDGVLATFAKLNSPWDIALDSNGNLYISDTNNHLIRKTVEINQDK